MLSETSKQQQLVDDDENRHFRTDHLKDDLAGRLAARGIILDQTAISRIENQTRYLMDYEIAAIAKSLKVSVGWLFGEHSRDEML